MVIIQDTEKRQKAAKKRRETRTKDRHQDEEEQEEEVAEEVVDKTRTITQIHEEESISTHFTFYFLVLAGPMHLAHNDAPDAKQVALG